MEKELNPFAGRLALQQRVLPAYRASFIDSLAAACQRGLSVFAGQALPQEQIPPIGQLQVAQYVPCRNYHFTHPASALYLCWQQGMTAWLEKWQPQALIVEANPRYLSTPRAVRWMHTRGLPVLGWGLGAPPLKGLGSLWRVYWRFSFLKSLDGVIAYSRRGAQEYLNLGLPASRIFVAPNATAPRPTTPPPIRPLKFQEAPRLLFVGRLQARKRVDNLLRACATLPRDLQPRLWIVGDGPARAELQALAQELYPHAEFIGACFGEALQAYFAAADLFVLPGTGGLSVQQAMASALPVIVAEGDGTQADLVRPQNGWQIPANNVEALTQALQSALSDPAALREKGMASYEMVRNEANVENMVRVFLQALSAVSTPER